MYIKIVSSTINAMNKRKMEFICSNENEVIAGY